MLVRRRTIRTGSPGYTLVEMMIVIAIIAVLIALTIPLIANVIFTTRKAATKATIVKIHELLQKRQDAFERGFPREFFQVHGIEYSAANVSHVIARKRRFQELFQLSNVPSWNSPATAADSAELLYKLLTDTEAYGTAAEDAGLFNDQELSDTDGDGRMELVDGWGRPIRYFVYPTRLFKPNGHVTTGSPPPPNGGVDRSAASYLFNSLMPDAQLNQDKDDPLDVLTGLPEATFHTYSTHHVLLVVSAGDDGLLGLYEPFDKSNYGHLARPNGNIEELYDNISNYNTRTGDD